MENKSVTERVQSDRIGRSRIYRKCITYVLIILGVFASVVIFGFLCYNLDRNAVLPATSSVEEHPSNTERPISPPPRPPRGFRTRPPKGPEFGNAGDPLIRHKETSQ